MNNSGESVLFQDCPSWGTGNNNGNLQSITANEGGPGAIGTLPAFSATYTYDNVNRLHTAADNSGAWSRTYEHDQFGNMWVSAATGGIPVSGLTPTANIYTGANRMGGQTYDAVGNQKAIGAYTLSYDAENRMIQATDAPSAGGGSVQ